MWSLDHLPISVPSKGRYKTTPPSPRVIKSFIQIPRQGQETRTKNKKTIVVGDNEILTREIHTHMKPWVDIIRENAICLGGHRDHVSACLCHMLYCIETSTPYNLAFFILKRMEKTRSKPKELLPYGMLLTRLFKHIVSISPELAFDHYLAHDRAMHLLAPHYERKTRADQGKKRPRESNASSSSTVRNTKKCRSLPIYQSSRSPPDIYTLVKSSQSSKDFMGESSITDAKLINDMNIYKMKMEQFQVNTKFLNCLPPEWSKFVTNVKLVKDLYTSNFDQLHAYLEQHELHANEVRIMRERNQDPLAFVANQQMTPPHFNTYQSYYNNPQLQQ
ncbi:hypothetical protein Tco_0693218 [Tanacetum coccineum]